MGLAFFLPGNLLYVRGHGRPAAEGGGTLGRGHGRRGRGRSTTVALVMSNLGDLENSQFGSLVPRNAELGKDVEHILDNPVYDFVTKVSPPDLVARFNRSSPPEVQAAFRATLVNMFGSLPSSLYQIQVRTLTSNIVQLMQTSIMTGYMFRNAEYRLSMLKGLESLKAEEPQPAQVDIVGTTAATGEKTDVRAQEYVDLLRSEVSSLRAEITRVRENTDATSASPGVNELLGYIGLMDGDTLKSMTKDAGPEVIDAMRRLIEGVVGKDEDMSKPVEISSNELATLLLFNMVSGYFLREAEVRMNFERSMSSLSSSDGSNDFSALPTKPDTE